ncbi:MAG TPA: cupredoxin domain-containing protein [Myxococcaceae bacterium]|nr:cupredoxin domain-containing protein [Myxococcaceae bacterium]
MRPGGWGRALLALGLVAAGGLAACKERPAPAQAPPAAAGPRVIPIRAKKFSYTPNRITVKQGEAVVLEFTSEDRKHGFKLPELGLRADIEPGKVTRVNLTAPRAGTFPFACDLFCGDGHEDMTGELVVQP